MVHKAKHYEIVFYCLLVCVLSVALLTLHSVFTGAGKYSISFPQFAPAISVFVFAALTRRKNIIKDVAKRFRPSSGVLPWVVLAVFLSFALTTVSGFILLPWEPHRMWGGNASFYFISIICILVCCTGEEIGWRGFLLPELMERFTPLGSALVLGMFWGFWHLNFSSGVLGFFFYTVTVMECSVMMTFLFIKSGGNVLPCVFMHAGWNLSCRLILWERFNIPLFIIEIAVFGVACLFMICADRSLFFHKPGIGSDGTGITE